VPFKNGREKCRAQGTVQNSLEATEQLGLTQLSSALAQTVKQNRGESELFRERPPTKRGGKNWGSEKRTTATTTTDGNAHRNRELNKTVLKNRTSQSTDLLSSRTEERNSEYSVEKSLVSKRCRPSASVRSVCQLTRSIQIEFALSQTF
jgi:hypothetical protein